MQKDVSYHKAAIQYNQELADFAAKLADKLENEEVARWCRSVSKQHKFHAGRHRKALSKLEQNEEEVEAEDIPKAKGDPKKPFEVPGADTVLEEDKQEATR